jgi:hypothetical protein
MQKLHELYIRITKTIPFKRPNCGEILEEKHLWALNKNEFECEKELIENLNLKLENEKFYIHSVFELELIEKNNEILKSIQSITDKESHILEI